MNKYLIGCLLVLSFSAMAENYRKPTFFGRFSEVAKGRYNSQEVSESPDESEKDSFVSEAIPEEKVETEAIDPGEIRNILQLYVPHFKFCYQQALDLSVDPSKIQGIVNLNFTIGAEGKVISSDITSSGTNSEKVQECLKNTLYRIQFSVPKEGRTVEVYQPLKLLPKRI